MKFHVPDMTCSHCVRSVTEAVKAISSNAHVVCDLDHNLVEVLDMVEASADKVIAALEDVGFEAALVESEA